MPTRAIETKFEGITFRSRAEARWACFFESLGVEWQYEPEGFELSPHRRYLPDFHLPSLWCYGDGVYFEVKGKEPTDAEERRCLDLARIENETVAVAIRAPIPPSVIWSEGRNESLMVYGYRLNDKGARVGRDVNHAFCECPTCGRIGITFGGVRGPRDICDCPADAENSVFRESKRILAAYVTARAHRFGT